MSKQHLHAGALVPTTGRVTITQKRNGRVYVGMDFETFAQLHAWVCYPGAPIIPKLPNAFKAFKSKLEGGC